MNDERVKEALEKCAVGFDTSEVVEEYTVENGNLVLVKKKITTRDIPPDLKAVKLLMEGESMADMTDEQLAKERENLLKMLKENNFE